MIKKLLKFFILFSKKVYCIINCWFTQKWFKVRPSIFLIKSGKQNIWYKPFNYILSQLIVTTHSSILFTLLYFILTRYITVRYTNLIKILLAIFLFKDCNVAVMLGVNIAYKKGWNRFLISIWLIFDDFVYDPILYKHW